MSGEPSQVISIGIMLLGVAALFANIVLQTKRKLPEKAFQRTTLLVLGMALTQVGMIAGRQAGSKDVIQICFLALLLVALAATAFVDGWRARAPEPSA